MKEITVQVKEEKYKFFLELIKNFDFVSVKNAVKKRTSLKYCQGNAGGGFSRKRKNKVPPS